MLAENFLVEDIENFQFSAKVPSNSWIHIMMSFIYESVPWPFSQLIANPTQY